MNPSLCIALLPHAFAVCRLEKDTTIPAWASHSAFYSITKTMDELSIVVEQSKVPTDIKAEKDWRALMIEGPLDFALTGVLSAILAPLAEAKISIFTISTFDTDYILIKEKNLEQAIKILKVQYTIKECFSSDLKK